MYAIQKPEAVSLEERLTHGNLSVSEVIALRGESRVTFYKALKQGRVSLIKSGHRSLVPGPIARRYIEG